MRGTRSTQIDEHHITMFNYYLTTVESRTCEVPRPRAWAVTDFSVCKTAHGDPRKQRRLVLVVLEHAMLGI